MLWRVLELRAGDLRKSLLTFTEITVGFKGPLPEGLVQPPHSTKRGESATGSLLCGKDRVPVSVPFRV